MSAPLHIDLFCRVVDNFGDIGVCWRLAADLGARGHVVRLRIDDGSALAWMAPTGAAGVEVCRWDDAVHVEGPGDLVIEAFGCDPPLPFVERMTRAARAPLWINLEYLSAEPYVQRSHGLPSPVSAGPGRGLTKWFFYPGFAVGSGGLIREPGLLDARSRFDRLAWLRAIGAMPTAAERVVSLFCYADAPVSTLLRALAQAPTLLLVTPGAAATALHAAGSAVGTALRIVALPWLTQHDFDRLLWSCDLNFVRGEDSLVRAIWAGAPFVWQAYPQRDGAHRSKLDALLDRLLDGAAAPLAAEVRALHHAWNGFAPGPAGLPDASAWRTKTSAWRQTLAAQPDLSTQLLGFAARKR